MKTSTALIAFAAITASIIPAVASERSLNQDVNISRARWALVRKQSVGATDVDKICRAYAASFYESVTLRQAVARCVDSEREVPALDFEVNAFNELLAAKCGG